MLSLALPIVGTSQKDERGVQADGRFEILQKLRGIQLESSNALVAQNASPQSGLFAVRAVH